jgi:hypothetical protein
MRREGQSSSSGVKRWWLLIILFCTLFLASLGLNVCQYRLAAQERLRATARKQAATEQTRQTQLEAEVGKVKKAREAKNDARVQQLYREINNLTQMAR